MLTGSQYLFRVRPVNTAGVGEAMEFEEPITVTSPYSKCAKKNENFGAFT